MNPRVAYAARLSAMSLRELFAERRRLEALDVWGSREEQIDMVDDAIDRREVAQ